MKPFSSVYIADGVAPGENVDIVEDIYVPALQNSNLHKRLTFSFSSPLWRVVAMRNHQAYCKS